MKRDFAVVVGRWTAIVVLSIAIMFPPVWAIASWGVERAEAQQRASRPAKGPAAQKDFGFGLRGLEALVIYTAGSFAVIWPLSLWASWRLLRNLGQRRREPSPAPPAAEVIRIEPQVLGAPPASAEDGDDRPVVAGAELPLDDAALGSLGDRR